MDLGHDTEHWGYVRVVLDDETHGVAQTWVRRVAAGQFEDVADSAFTYTETRRHRLLLWVAGAGLILVAAGLVILVWRRKKRQIAD